MRFSIILILLSIINLCQAQSIIPVSDFSHKKLSDWQEKSFEGKTHYQLIKHKGQYVLEARSNKSASGLYKEIKINLNQTPYLNWSWFIDNQLERLDEQSKNGDDYVARVYVVSKHPLFFWKTKALNYVWSSNQEKFSHWSNAYTSQAQMFAVQGKHSDSKQWYAEKRNVKEDFKRVFGEEIDEIDVIAIMSDTDNSKLSSKALYGELFFSSE